MRTNFFAGLALMALTAAACGGENPPPQPPPPPPPPATASATAAPVDTTPPPPPPKPVLSEVIPQVLKGLHDADEAHDSVKQASFLADDVVTYFYGSVGKAEMHGKDDVIGRFAKTAFSDAEAAPTRVWIKGNVAVVEFTWTGKMTGDLPGLHLKATNRPIGQKRAVVYVFNDDGLVKEERIYSDTLGMQAQLKGDKNAPPLEPLPTGAPEVHVGKGTPDEDKLVDWAKKVDDAFNTGDVKQATAFLADDVVYDAWGAPSLKGKKANEKDLRSFFKAFPDQKWTPTNVMGIDGYVVIEHVFTGTQKAPYGRFTKVTGKPVTGEHYLEIWQPSADGKLVHGWGYSNPVEALQQTGVMEKGGQEKPPPTSAAGK